MCFYNDDCDWYVEVEDREFVRGESRGKCCECSRVICAWEWRLNVHQQEHEMCQLCEDGESDDYISDDADDYDSDEEHAAALAELAAHKHHYGEEFSATICRECCLLLEAVYDLETKEGCPEYARQPAYGELFSELHEDSGKYGEQKYVKHAVALFPELAMHVLR